MEKAKQEGYDVGVAETEKTLRADGFVEPTTSKYGIRLLTKLEWRPLPP